MWSSVLKSVKNFPTLAESVENASSSCFLYFSRSPDRKYAVYYLCWFWLRSPPASIGFSASKGVDTKHIIVNSSDHP